MTEETKFFEKKYNYKIDIVADDKLIIPEYRIELMNKSKKVLNIYEYIKKIDGENINKKSAFKSTKDNKKTKKMLKKLK